MKSGFKCPVSEFSVSECTISLGAGGLTSFFNRANRYIWLNYRDQ